MTDPFIRVHQLRKYFPVYTGTVWKRKIAEIRAVDDISFTIERGRTLGLVGESGCGKTTAARTILGLEPPTAGEIFFDDINIAQIDKRAMRAIRKRMQIIFQDPYSALNPRMTVRRIIGEPLIIHNLAGNKKEYNERIQYLLETVGLNPDMADRFPHEFSGGQRQRIGIARSLALDPEFIVCDEPVTALDVSIQAQIINLLEEIQQQFNLTVLFISHDLAIVRYISERIAVMYGGSIVEMADRDDLCSNPQHPYTALLLSAVPSPEPDTGREITLRRQPPDSEEADLRLTPTGCKFYPRCPQRINICKEDAPQLKQRSNHGHYVACHLAGA